MEAMAKGTPSIYVLSIVEGQMVSRSAMMYVR